MISGNSNQLLSTREAAEMLNVSGNTLFAYAREGLIVPERQPAGRRYYMKWPKDKILELRETLRAERERRQMAAAQR